MNPAIQFSTPIRLPIIQKEISLRPHEKKVILVALASIVFFGIQMSLCLASTMALSALITSVTYFSEVHLRKGQGRQIDWLNENFSWQKEALALLIFFSIRPFLAVFLAVSLNLKVSLPPQKHLLDLLRTSPLRMFVVGGILAPIVEEILFRGFLLERLEDAAYLLKRFASIKLPDSTAVLAQGILFGVIHVKKAMHTIDQWTTAIAISAMGVLFAKCKNNDQTLVSPITLHAANNLSVISTFALLDRYNCFK